MIVIVNYGLGNLNSVKNALDFLGVPSIITSDIQEIKKADKIILPGVGAFGYAMERLRQLNLIDTLHEEVIIKRKPFLGICLGMQLICTKSYEEGEFEGLKWIDADVVRFNSKDLVVPHVGWNTVECNDDSPIFTGGNKNQTFYFVHSYYPNVKDEKIVTGWCEYGVKFPAALQKDNIFAVQFHPEKSHTEGSALLKKFVEL